MPKTLSRKRVSEEYVSDDGFVDDDNAPPKSKRSKAGAAGPGIRSGSGALKDDDGNEYWELSNKRRVQVSQFGKTWFVNIREFYEANGKMLPGKKGIALNVEQFNALVTLLPQIEKALQPKTPDVKLARPKYDTPASEGNGDGEGGEEEEAEAGEEEDDEKDDKPVRERTRKTSSSSRHEKKANHEATSSEDEG